MAYGPMNDFNVGGYSPAPPSSSLGGYVSPTLSPYQQGYSQPYNPNPNALPGVSFGQPTYSNPYEFRGLFNDPSTVPLMSALTSRVGQLAQPGPQFSEYTGALQSGLAQLMTPLANDPTVGAAMTRLLSGGGAMPANAYEGQYAQRTNDAYTQLMQEPFSAGEEAAMKEKYFGQIQMDHTTARQQTLEQLAGMGVAPTSGTAIAALQAVDKNYEQQYAGAQNQLLTDTVALRDQRHAAALQASQQLAGYGQGEQQVAAQFRNIQMQAIAQAAQLAMQQREQAQSRLLAGIGVGGNLAALQQQQYQTQQSNWDQLLQLSGVPSALVQQRMGTLGSALSSPGDINSGLNQLATGYGTQATQQANRNAANTKAIGGGLANIYDTYQQQRAAPPQYGGYTTVPSYSAGYYNPSSVPFSGGTGGYYPTMA